MKKNKVTYPSKYLAHWVTGAVPCCEEHCKQLVGIGRFMGSVIPVSENDDKTLECSNCINENKKNNLK